MSNGRQLESFVHGIPLYPFSNTPDGRIVGELHRARTEQQNFQSASLEIQRRALSELSRIHGGRTTIPAVDLHGQATRDALMGITTELGRLHMAQSATSQTIASLNETAQRGFGTVHDDLDSIKGPERGTKSMDDLIREDLGGMAAISSYVKGVLNSTGATDVELAIYRKMANWEKTFKGTREQVRAGIEDRGYDIKQFPEIIDALYLLNQAFSLASNIAGNPQEIRAKTKILRHLAGQFQIDSLAEFADQVEDLCKVFDHARDLPLDNNTLLVLAQNELLTGPMQHRVMERYPQTRGTASMATLNYHLGDILRANMESTRIGVRALEQREGMLLQGGISVAQNQRGIQQRDVLISQGYTGIRQGDALIGQGQIAISQRDKTNYRLGAILGSLTSLNTGVVDLGKLVTDFTGVVEEGFEKIDATFASGFEAMGEGLEKVATEMALTRAAVHADLVVLARGIDASTAEITATVRQGNLALAHLVSLTESSHNVEAAQYFADGIKCLQTATNPDDLKDAYVQFCKGAEVMAASVENQYGAAYSAELLGMLDEALSRYNKASKRANKDQYVLASLAHEGIARIDHKKGKTSDAAEDIKKAIEKDPKNGEARYDQVKYLILLGLVDEGLEKLLELCTVRPEYYLKFRGEEFFGGLAVEKLREFWKGALDFEILNSPRNLIIILEDTLEAEVFDLAAGIFMRLLETSPRTLIDRQIWLHPELNKMFKQKSVEINFFIVNKLAALSAEKGYEICAFLFYWGLPDNVLVRAFKVALAQDPLFYAKDKPETKEKLKQKLEKGMEVATGNIIEKLRFECGDDPNFGWIFEFQV